MVIVRHTLLQVRIFYGSDHEVIKLDCIGHFGKRMYSTGPWTLCTSDGKFIGVIRVEVNIHQPATKMVDMAHSNHLLPHPLNGSASNK